MEKAYHKLVTFVRTLSKQKDPIDKLFKDVRLTELDGESAEDIFINGTDFMEADIAIKARSLLREIEE